MSDLAAKGVVTLGEGEGKVEVIVSELTPGQMRQMLLTSPWPGEDASEEDVARYRVDVWLFEECRLSDLALYTNLKITELEALPPTQLRKLLAKAKELNPDFFGALGRMAEAQSKHL